MTKSSTKLGANNLIGVVLWLVLLSFIFAIPFFPLSLNKAVTPTFLNSNGNESALVFFGYRGCSDVCPLTLSTFRQLLDSQANESKWPQVVFVDIDTYSNTEQAIQFASHFHPAFTGLHLNQKQLAEFSNDFGLHIKQDENQIKHLGKTYLLKRNEKLWRLIKVYNPSSLTLKTLRNDIFNGNS